MADDEDGEIGRTVVGGIAVEVVGAGRARCGIDLEVAPEQRAVAANGGSGQGAARHGFDHTLPRPHRTSPAYDRVSRAAPRNPPALDKAARDDPRFVRSSRKSAHVGLWRNWRPGIFPQLTRSHPRSLPPASRGEWREAPKGVFPRHRHLRRDPPTPAEFILEPASSRSRGPVLPPAPGAGLSHMPKPSTIMAGRKSRPSMNADRIGVPARAGPRQDIGGFSVPPCARTAARSHLYMDPRD